jgi:protein-L-isoaspartate(D-aspartate) O-methyltransferase
MRRRRSEGTLVAAARRAGVIDERVLAALAAVPRERFVPPGAERDAALDRPIPIGSGQTTSQPSLIASMLAALELTGTERVLEIGTGFGYQTALLAHLAAKVFSIERLAPLAARAREHLAVCGLENVEVVVGDGTRGLPEAAPFDAIVIAAAAAAVPAGLAGQMVAGGRLVAPVGPSLGQQVVVYTARDGRLEDPHRLSAVRFVPLIGDEPDGG